MTMATTAPKPALLFTPPDFLHDSGELAAWFTEPAGIVVQFPRPACGTRLLVEWLLGVVEPALRDRFPDRRDLFFVLDLRFMTSREASARSLLLERAPAFRGRFARTYIVPPERSGALAVMSIQAAAALLRTFGIPVAVERSIDTVRSACGLPSAPSSL